MRFHRRLTISPTRRAQIPCCWSRPLMLAGCANSPTTSSGNRTANKFSLPLHPVKPRCPSRAGQRTFEGISASTTTKRATSITCSAMTARLQSARFYTGENRRRCKEIKTPELLSVVTLKKPTAAARLYPQQAEGDRHPRPGKRSLSR